MLKVGILNPRVAILCYLYVRANPFYSFKGFNAPKSAALEDVVGFNKIPPIQLKHIYSCIGGILLKTWGWLDQKRIFTLMKNTHEDNQLKD